MDCFSPKGFAMTEKGRFYKKWILGKVRNVKRQKCKKWILVNAFSSSLRENPQGFSWQSKRSAASLVIHNSAPAE